MYNKIATALQGQLLNQLHLIDSDFEQLCTVATSINTELKCYNKNQIAEHDAQLAKTTTMTARTPATGLFTSAKLTSAGFLLLQQPNLMSSTLVKGSDLFPKYYNCYKTGHVAHDCLKP